jgi:3,4-dihydroxy 2-butanone 4-phosphate synthase / GTP cyclohydrolase II
MTLISDLLEEFSVRMPSPSQDVATALHRMRSGDPVVVGHDTGAVMVLHGATALTAAVATLIRHGSGLVFVAMQRERLRALEIPELVADVASQCPRSHVAVDASDGIGTGISAADRAETIRRLGDPRSAPCAFGRPGHVIPVAADLVVGTVPTAPQVALMLALLTAESTPAAAYTSMVSIDHPTAIADSAESAMIANQLSLSYVDASSVIRAFYES